MFTPDLMPYLSNALTAENLGRLESLAFMEKRDKIKKTLKWNYGLIFYNLVHDNRQFTALESL